MNRRVLVVDDEANVRKALTTTLKKEGYDALEAEHGVEALELVMDAAPQVVLLDLRMPGMDGMEIFRRLKALPGPQPTVVVMTAYGSATDVMEAMKLGAFDYVQKPFDLAQVKRIVAKAMAEAAPGEADSWGRAEEAAPLEPLVGLSPKMREVYKLVGKVSTTKATVLIQGESGTGKELIARAIHANSPRASKPYVCVNCGAIPETLLESELFGHERGAFTGAVDRKPGMFEMADGGTIFLDEIGEMSLSLQVKLLRVLQERSFTRVGGVEPVPVDVRVIAATNQDLAEKIRQKQFRADLYYRLNVVPIFVPPLRERKEDIPLLVDHFLRKYRQEMNKPVNRIAPQALDLLMAYDWPGNVRELENVIERAMVMANGTAILPEHVEVSIGGLRPEPLAARGTHAYEGKKMRDILREVEADVIRYTLAQTRGNKLRAAERLGMSRRALLYKIRDYGIEAGENG